jgi:hypothetical protein
MMTEDEVRKAFEATYADSSGLGRLARIPSDPCKHAWPGQYINYETHLAWLAWNKCIAWMESRESPSFDVIAEKHGLQHHIRRLEDELEAARAGIKISLPSEPKEER